jgi:outer membrane protein
LDANRQRFQVGLGTVTAVHEAQAHFDQSEANLVATQKELEHARAQLQELTQQPPEALAPLDPQTSLIFAASPEDCAGTALQHNRALKAQAEQEAATHGEIRRAEVASEFQSS